MTGRSQRWWCFHSAGLNAGDEILQLNGKDAHSLNFSDMKAAFSQASLTLMVNTLPSVDRRQLCYLPPRRSDAEEDLYTDIFSQSQGEKFCQIQLGSEALNSVLQPHCEIAW